MLLEQKKEIISRISFLVPKTEPKPEMVFWLYYYHQSEI